MTRTQALEWALKNLPEWPKSSQNHINIPSRVWAFIGNKNTAIINVQTGELITRDEFYAERQAAPTALRHELQRINGRTVFVTPITALVYMLCYSYFNETEHTNKGKYYENQRNNQRVPQISQGSKHRIQT